MPLRHKRARRAAWHYGIHSHRQAIQRLGASFLWIPVSPPAPRRRAGFIEWVLVAFVCWHSPKTCPPGIAAFPMDVWRWRAMDGHSTEIDAAPTRLIPFLTFDSGSHPFFEQEVALRIGRYWKTCVTLVRNCCDFTWMILLVIPTEVFHF